MARRKGRSTSQNDVKKSNKSKNKLAKRGIVKKKDRKLVGAWYRRQLDKQRTVQAERLFEDLEVQRNVSSDEEDALPLDMVDSADQWPKMEIEVKVEQQQPKKSKRDYDDQVRSFGKIERLKQLLPIKSVDGNVIAQTTVVDDGDEDEEDDASLSSNDDKPKTQPEDEDYAGDPPSMAELYAKRETLVNDHKQRIAALCYSIVENPQDKVQKLKELLELASGEAVPLIIRFTIQKLATASLAEIFLDIIPGYRVRLLSDEEKKQQMKKETRQLATFEEALLRNYKKFLQLLEKFSSSLMKKETNTAKNTRKKDVLGKLAVQVLSKLLTTHPHFNFRSNIIMVLTPLMSHVVDEIRETACLAMEHLFRTDRGGEATLDAVKSICRYLKTQSKFSHNRMLLTLLHLRIKEVEKKDARGKSKKDLIVERKRKLLSMSRKEKKMQKRLRVLEKELQEVELEENTNAVLKLHTNIMNEVFATYFRILRHSPTSKLLPAVLAGLSKFAHLINVEFVDEVVTSLRQLVDSTALKPLEKLHCINAAFVILSGEGQALTVDPYRFYANLYMLLPRALQETSREMQLNQFQSIFGCLDLMINKRRKQVSISRVAAFTKRLCQLCLIMADPECAACLLAIRSCFIAHPQLEAMLDDDERVGGAYRPELDDPEHCNAFGTTLIRELDLLSRHPNDTVKRLASHLRFKLPSQGRHRLPTDLVTAAPSRLMMNMESASSNPSGSFSKRATVKERLKRFGKEADLSTEEISVAICKSMKFV